MTEHAQTYCGALNPRPRAGLDRCFRRPDHDGDHGANGWTWPRETPRLPLDPWEARYRLAVAKHAGAPDGLDPADIHVEVSASDGSFFSAHTQEDADISVTVRWPGDPMRIIDGPEAVAALIRSFSTGATS